MSLCGYFSAGNTRIVRATQGLYVPPLWSLDEADLHRFMYKSGLTITTGPFCLYRLFALLSGNSTGNRALVCT
jgi:hypothetical protein